jgi:hypothetical protein
MGEYLPLWRRQQILASVGAKIVRPAPAPPDLVPERGNTSGKFPEALPPHLWMGDALDEPEPYPPMGEAS